MIFNIPRNQYTELVTKNKNLLLTNEKKAQKLNYGDVIAITSANYIPAVVKVTGNEYFTSKNDMKYNAESDVFFDSKKAVREENIKFPVTCIQFEKLNVYELSSLLDSNDTENGKNNSRIVFSRMTYKLYAFTEKMSSVPFEWYWKEVVPGVIENEYEILVAMASDKPEVRGVAILKTSDNEKIVCDLMVDNDPRAAMQLLAESFKITGDDTAK